MMSPKLLVAMAAGLGAGIGTGFAGLSAAAVIAPALITFLHYDPYGAVGIALASDVLASAVSAYIYGRHGNLDIRNGIVMMVTVLCFTFLGSYLGKLAPSQALGGFSVFMPLLLGCKFIIHPVMENKRAQIPKSRRRSMIESIAGGMVIGAICGFVGAGGGLMMLAILVGVLGYELKTAIGTSVFIMSFTAFTGAVSHMALGTMPDTALLVTCVVSTFLGARIAAILANKASERTLNRITGTILLALGIVMVIVRYR